MAKTKPAVTTSVVKAKPTTKPKAEPKVEPKAKPKTEAKVLPQVTKEVLTDALKTNLKNTLSNYVPKPPKEKTGPVKTKRTGVGKLTVELLKSGLSVNDTYQAILKMAEENCVTDLKTTKACVSWYKSKINNGYF